MKPLTGTVCAHCKAVTIGLGRSRKLPSKCPACAGSLKISNDSVEVFKTERSDFPRRRCHDIPGQLYLPF